MALLLLLAFLSLLRVKLRKYHRLSSLFFSVHFALLVGISGGQGDEDQRRNNSSSSSSSSSLSSFTSSAKAMLGLDGASSSYTGNHGAGGGDFSTSSHNRAGGGGGNDNQGGNSYNSSGNNYSGGRGSGMTGIGNPHFKEEQTSSLTSRMSAVASGMFSKKSPDNNNSNNTNKNRGNTVSDDYQFRSNRPHSFGNNNSNQSTGAWGPNGVNNNNNINNNNNGSNNNGSGGGMVNPNPIVDLPASSEGGVGRAGGASSSGEYERGLVEALCCAGGMKVNIRVEADTYFDGFTAYVADEIITIRRYLARTS